MDGSNTSLVHYTRKLFGDDNRWTLTFSNNGTKSSIDIRPTGPSFHEAIFYSYKCIYHLSICFQVLAWCPVFPVDLLHPAYLPYALIEVIFLTSNNETEDTRKKSNFICVKYCLNELIQGKLVRCEPLPS